MTWFLFGASAIPMLLAMIQRTGINMEGSTRSAVASGKNQNPMLVYIHSAMTEFREEMDWVQNKGDYILSSFLVPPLQILAVCINFCTLLIGGNHLFQLPFRSFQDILDTKDLIEKARKSVRKD
jgi:hypothetical protein